MSGDQPGQLSTATPTPWAQCRVVSGNWEVELRSTEHLEDNAATWSDEVFQILGYEPGQVVPSSQAFFAVVHPDDHASIRYGVHRALAGDGQFTNTHRIVRPMGDVRFVHEHVRVVYDPEGHRPPRLIGTIQDVTEQARTEEQFRGVLEAAPDAMVIVDAQMQIAMANVQAEVLFRCGRAALIGRPIETLVPERHRLLHREYQKSFTADPKPRPMGWGKPLCARRADGTEFPAEISLSPYRTADGLWVIASIRDTTDREETLAQLRAQSILLERATDAIAVRDLSDRVQFWNPAAERIFGYKAEEMIGKPGHTTMLLPRAQYLAAKHNTLRLGEWSGELNPTTKAGKVLTVQTRWTLLRDSQEQPHAVLIMATDVTEQKEIESQLLRSQRMESIGSVAGGIAHDLNNALAPISISIALLRDKVADPEDRRILDIVASSAERSRQLVKQVLSFARGADEPRTIITPAKLFQEIESIAHETFPKSIVTTSNVAPDAGLIRGNFTQLQQVLLNLCVNARDAMPSGGRLQLDAATVTVPAGDAVLPKDAIPGSYLRLSVRDSGTGIPPPLRDKIFEAFFTTKKTGEGTGLGLATSQLIVRHHGGFIALRSHVGVGSEFQVYLPVAADDLSIASATSIAPFPLQGAGELILVVDDEEPIRTTIECLLTNHGYRVLTASGGDEAVQLYSTRGSAIAAVLTDLAMPETDGVVTSLALRRLNPEVKIVALTGMVSHISAAEKMGASFNQVVEKPFAAESLLRVVAQLLGKTAPK